MHPYNIEVAVAESSINPFAKQIEDGMSEQRVHVDVATGGGRQNSND